MIRDGVESDIPSLLRMGRKFHEAAGLADIATWDDESFRATLSRMIGADSGIVLVIDRGEIVGMAGAVIYPFYFNAGHRTCQEIFWWVEPEARGSAALLEMLEARAGQGGESLIMSNIDSLRPEALARYYRIRGFRAAENTFIKRV